MTKEQFMSGVPFNYRQGATVKPYRFEWWPDWKNGDPVGSLMFFIAHEANVTKVTVSYFDCYSTILGKVIKARFYFKDLHT